jgi:hypothetical protein
VIGPPFLFLLLSALFLWQPLTTGQVFLPTDLSFRYDYLWKALESTPGLTVAQNPLLSDVADYYYPYARFAMERLGSGHFPLWNPYIFTGEPFFATAQAAVLDPINLLTYLAGPYAYWTWGAWLRLALLGWTMYGLLRALGRGAGAGLGAGVVFMICGFVMAWLNYSVVTTLAWLPALFWATTRLLQTGRWIWGAATAAALGAMFLGGHRETQILIGLFWPAFTIYALLVLRQRGPGGPAFRRQAGLVVGAGAIGVGLAAIQLVTFVDFLFSSSAIAARRSTVQSFDLGETALRLTVLFFPNFTGNPLERTYWLRALTNFNEQTGYFGLLAVALAVLGAVYWGRRDRLVPFLVGAGVLALLLAIKAPGFHLIKALPLFNVGHGVRWVLVWSFCGAVLVGYGLDALAALRPRAAGTRRAALGVAAATLAAGGFLLIIYLGLRLGNWDQAWQPILSHERMVRLFQPPRLTMYAPVVFLAAGAAILLARWRGRLPAAATIAGLIVLLYADLWLFGSRYNPVTPVTAIYPPNEPLRYLQAHLGHDRFVGAIGTLRPNVPMVFGLRDVRGYEDVIDEPFARLYGPVLNSLSTMQQGGLRLTAEEHRLLRVAGARYLLTPRKPDVAGRPRVHQWRLEEGQAAIYEDPAALPRAYVLYNATVTPDLAAATRALLAPAHDPRRTVILTGGGDSATGPPDDVTATPVTWQRDEPEEVALAATLPAPGYLVLSDSYAPGWEATLDGRPAPILRANVVFRAVAVPAGAHVVRFQYRPPLFSLGVLISTLAALAILGLIGAEGLARRRAA